MSDVVVAHAKLEVLEMRWRQEGRTEDADALREARGSGHASPTTRDLSAVVDACRVVEQELRFQADRLVEVLPRTPAEEKHVGQQERGYRLAAANVQQLREYHEARLRREALTGSTEPDGAKGFGPSAAFTEGG